MSRHKAKGGNRFTSNLKLSIGAFVLAGLVIFLQGATGLFSFFLGFSIFFAFIAFIERMAMKSAGNEVLGLTKPISSNNTIVPVSATTMGNDAGVLTAAGFRMVSDSGDMWYEMKVDVGKGYVIRLPPEERLALQVLSEIGDLLKNPQVLIETVKRLRDDRASRLPGVENAVVKYVSFDSSRDLDVGEVYLEDPDGNSWACVYRNGTVTDLNAAD